MMNNARMPGFARENSAKLGAGLVLALQTPFSWAQQAEPQSYPYSGHMMWGNGWFGMFFGLVSMFLLIFALFGGFALVVRWFGAQRHGGHPPQHPPSRQAPLDILRERYARGEIEKEEFEERRRVLGD